MSSALVREPELVNIYEASDVSPADGLPVKASTVTLKFWADVLLEGKAAVVLRGHNISCE
jgi:hypothetical protein